MKYKKTIIYKDGGVFATIIKVENKEIIDHKSFHSLDVSMGTYMRNNEYKIRKEQFAFANKWADRLIEDLNDLVIE